MYRSVLWMAAIVLIVIYTVSYGVYEWKKKNKFGAIMVFLVSLACLTLPAYQLFFL